MGACARPFLGDVRLVARTWVSFFIFFFTFFHQSLQVRNNEVGRVIKLVGGKDIRVFCTRA